MRFPLADWIDDHVACRHNLGSSGMFGSVAHPLPTRREVLDASSDSLVRRLAEGLGVEPARVFLTPGATEANAWVTLFLARRRSGTLGIARVRYPEYPPLVDVARWAGFRLDSRARRVGLAVVSLPRNPEGVLWSNEELLRWSDGARSVLIDETFRPFSGGASFSQAGRAGVWATGSFTKFYAADDVRVGFAVAPPEEAAAFARFHGLVTDEINPYSVASALRILDAGGSLADRVLRIFERNRAVLARALPEARRLRAPVFFDRVPDGDRLAGRCLRHSILVCPGSFFGVRRGVRLSLTRRSFPEDLSAYLRVRETVVSARLSAGHPGRRRLHRPLGRAA